MGELDAEVSTCEQISVFRAPTLGVEAKGLTTQGKTNNEIAMSELK